MAKIIKVYKGYKIKETTKRDNTTYKYWVCLPDDTNFVDWESDTFMDCIGFIDSKLIDQNKPLVKTAKPKVTIKCSILK